MKKLGEMLMAHSLRIEPCVDPDCGCGSVWIVFYDELGEPFAAGAVAVENHNHLVEELDDAIKESIAHMQCGGHA